MRDVLLGGAIFAQILYYSFGLDEMFPMRRPLNYAVTSYMKLRTEKAQNVNFFNKFIHKYTKGFLVLYSSRVL